MITTKKLYRYLGRNGIITSPVLLEKVEPIKMYELIPSPGKLLTNGIVIVPTKIVFADELEDWFEIDDPNSKWFFGGSVCFPLILKERMEFTVIVIKDESNLHLYNALFAEAYQLLEKDGKVREDCVHEDKAF